MAYNRAYTLLLATMLVLAGSGPPTQAQDILLSGELCCTPTGNCPGQGVPGVLVSLNCTNTLGGGTIAVSQTRTSINGTFNATVPVLTNLLQGMPVNFTCLAGVRLPLNSTLCPVLSTTNGTLVATGNIVGRVPNATSTLIGCIVFRRFIQVLV
ncbi:Unknown protein [Striga hermonthica]|uniref:Uncharacterized protein n=1 Tax=Striga hermonthica TaxID=68872 RepID=A0A9N7MLK7_STRHE|nr:Unknown protein [Striga hermonthica]